MIELIEEKIEKGGFFLRFSIEWQRSDLPQHRVGSPFGFTEQDWEYVLQERERKQTCKVVFGYQFHSQYYDAERLRRNLWNEFSSALQHLNAEAKSQEIVEFLFVPLAAGYGEHIFTDIVRDIISADIAVFETSDANPNVMIEMGVALTWGVSVWLIKRKGTSSVPTDVSGQSWTEYEQDGQLFHAQNHRDSLVAMIERAMLRKLGS